MSSRKISKIKRSGSRGRQTAHARELDLICHSEEQIYQIKGARNALGDVVTNCSKHLNVSLAVLILGNKGITLRTETDGEPLANSDKLVRELDKKLTGWLETATKGAAADLDALTTVNLDMLRQYRPTQNVLSRPVAQGRGHDIAGHHEILLPLLRQAIIERYPGT